MNWKPGPRQQKKGSVLGCVRISRNKKEGRRSRGLGGGGCLERLERRGGADGFRGFREIDLQTALQSLRNRRLLGVQRAMTISVKSNQSLVVDVDEGR